MKQQGAGHTRRWHSVIAVVAALSVFVALVAGSALRQRFAAAALPEPAAWSQITPDTGAHPDPTAPQGHSSAQPALVESRPAAPANKTNTKPFRSTWITMERPMTWNRLSAQSVLSGMPLSLSALGFETAGGQARAPTSGGADRDILTQFCVARR